VIIIKMHSAPFVFNITGSGIRSKLISFIQKYVNFHHGFIKRRFLRNLVPRRQCGRGLPTKLITEAAGRGN